MTTHHAATCEDVAGALYECAALGEQLVTSATLAAESLMFARDGIAPAGTQRHRDDVADLLAVLGRHAEALA